MHRVCGGGRAEAFLLRVEGPLVFRKGLCHPVDLRKPAVAVGVTLKGESGSRGEGLVHL